MNRKVLSILGIGLVCLALIVVSGGRQLLADRLGESVPGLISYLVQVMPGVYTEADLVVVNSGISYVGNKFTGAGTGLRCVHNYNLGTWAALSDGAPTQRLVTITSACRL